MEASLIGESGTGIGIANVFWKASYCVGNATVWVDGSTHSRGVGKVQLDFDVNSKGTAILLELSAEDAGSNLYWSTKIDASTGSRTVDLGSLVPTAPIPKTKIRVLSEEGTPVAGVRVVLRANIDGGVALVRTESGPDGVLPSDGVEFPLFGPVTASVELGAFYSIDRLQLSGGVMERELVVRKNVGLFALLGSLRLPRGLLDLLSGLDGEFTLVSVGGLGGGAPRCLGVVGAVRSTEEFAFRLGDLEPGKHELRLAYWPSGYRSGDAVPELSVIDSLWSVSLGDFLLPAKADRDLGPIDCRHLFYENRIWIECDSAVCDSAEILYRVVDTESGGVLPAKMHEGQLVVWNSNGGARLSVWCPGARLAEEVFLSGEHRISLRPGVLVHTRVVGDYSWMPDDVALYVRLRLEGSAPTMGALTDRVRCSDPTNVWSLSGPGVWVPEWSVGKDIDGSVLFSSVVDRELDERVIAKEPESPAQPVELRGPSRASCEAAVARLELR